MTIAFVIPTLLPGGAERVISRLSLHLAQRHAIAVITWDGRDQAFPFGGELIDLRLPARNTFAGKLIQQRKRIAALGQVLNRTGARQAIGFMNAANVPLIEVRQRMRLPIHITVSIRSSPMSFHGFTKWNMRRLYPRADRIALQTEAGLRTYAESWGFPASRCCVIPNPLADDMLGTPPPDPASRIPGLVLAVGRLVKEKNYFQLLEAIATLHAGTGFKELRILGEGPLRPQIERRIAELGLNGKVTLDGHATDVRPWLDRASLFVLSSDMEGFPNALGEAMARGCSIVSTDCPTGPGEMIRHEHSGLLVPTGDAAALGMMMRRMLSDHSLSTACGRNARTAAERWAIERIAPAWIIE